MPPSLTENSRSPTTTGEADLALERAILQGRHAHGGQDDVVDGAIPANSDEGRAVVSASNARAYESFARAALPEAESD